MDLINDCLCFRNINTCYWLLWQLKHTVMKLVDHQGACSQHATVYSVYNSSGLLFTTKFYNAKLILFSTAQEAQLSYYYYISHVRLVYVVMPVLPLDNQNYNNIYWSSILTHTRTEAVLVSVCFVVQLVRDSALGTNAVLNVCYFSVFQFSSVLFI